MERVLTRGTENHGPVHCDLCQVHARVYFRRVHQQILKYRKSEATHGLTLRVSPCNVDWRL